MTCPDISFIFSSVHKGITIPRKRYLLSYTFRPIALSGLAAGGQQGLDIL